MHENISALIEKLLPPNVAGMLRNSGLAGAHNGLSVYLVGGMVRDLLLGRLNLDLDLVVEGSAAEFAEALKAAYGGKPLCQSQFGTSKLDWDGIKVDVASARRETYARPGALPAVSPGDLKSDLFRRDFTINTMAVNLLPENYGLLIDMYGGKQDLEAGLIRVLHDKSFIDDPTRIWRAVKYEQRLDFQIEPHTLALLANALPTLDAVSGDRIRHELEKVLEEELPEKALCRASGLGVLQKIHPALTADEWLARSFRMMRASSHPEVHVKQAYLCLLVYRLSARQMAEFAGSLNLPTAWRQMLFDVAALKTIFDVLGYPALRPGQIYSILESYDKTALQAVMVVAPNDVVRERIALFLNKLSGVKPLLTGHDLLLMGVARGVKIGQIIEELRQARLDGRVNTRDDEVSLVTALLAR